MLSSVLFHLFYNSNNVSRCYAVGWKLDRNTLRQSQDSATIQSWML